jgi:purine-nucleoside phosphorylase
MENFKIKIDRASAYLKENILRPVKVGLVLGSGMGTVVEGVNVKFSVGYKDIPGFPEDVIEGHKGELLHGDLGGKELLIFNGRYHYYQGFHLREVTLPVRVAKRMGVETLIVTNASGAINRGFQPGDIMLITDHINLMGNNPLIGADVQDFGVRFVDMTEPYDLELIAKVKQLALKNAKIGELKEGVYVAVSGPSYETKAEILFFEKAGADTVGMSTVPEVIVAAQESIRVLGLSVISNMACGITESKLSHEEVLENMKKVSSRMLRLLELIMQNI